MDYPSSAGREGDGRLRVREYGPEDGYRVEARPDAIEQALGMRSTEGVGRTEQARPAAQDVEAAEGRTAVPEAEAVAARLLAEVLALDLGTMTPIRALTLLHELQTQAREAVPWSRWMASMAGARDQSEQR